MKLDKAVKDALNGKGVNGSIYARFTMPPITEVEIRPNVIFNLCAEKRVIHLGCTDHLPLIDQKLENGTYLHRQLTYVASECIGVDINEEAIEHIRKRGITNVITGDMTKPGINAIENTHWDFIVIPDVIEHIPNPAGFLSAINEAYGMYADKILITTPCAFANSFNILTGFTTETINFDHCFWFTPYTLCKVVHAAELEIDEIFMCSYENPTASIRKREEYYKKFPMLLNTIVLTAFTRNGNKKT